MKRNILMAVSGSIIIIFGIISYFKINENIVYAVAKPSESITIVLDAGHGGMDGGASGASSIEKDINLDITLKLADMLTLSGYEVVLTRDKDISIHDNGLKSIHEQKVSDLRNRLKLVKNQINPYFFSIHQNHFGQSQYSGAQMFYSENNEESKLIAQILQDKFVSNLQKENKRQIKPAGNNLYLLYNLKCPAVLIECGFLSNPAEEKLLNNGEYRTKVAFTIYSSITAYFDSRE